jgi:hypothetical protein
MAANTTPLRKFAGWAAAASVKREIAMSTTTDTKPATRTRKAPAKPAPEVVDHDSGVTADEVKRTYRAEARSGQVTTRTSAVELKFAVDVKIADARKASYAEGVVTKMFATKEAAEKMAAEVNSGELGQRLDFYATATDAIVVAVQLVEESAK